MRRQTCHPITASRRATARPLPGPSPAARRAGAAILAVGLLLLISGPHAHAQPTTRPGSELTVYLVTMGPGQAIYERFGHNALWVRDRLNGTDYAFNYGVFDMGQSGFILRFLQGRMWYWVEAWDALKMIEAYKSDNRTIWLQELNLTPSQRLELYRFLLWNAQPANREYRYDYYTDNCSTRVRDALDAALGRQISQALGPRPSNVSYRWHTRRITQHDPLMYTALDFVLGPFIDRPISAWEECYLPLELQRRLRDVTVLDESGRPVPLVVSEATVHQGTRPPLAAEPPRWLGWYLAAGILLALAVAALAWASPRRKPARWALAVLSAIWLFVVGFAGWFSLYAWLLTTHVAAYRNENLLHASPAALCLALLLPALAFGKRWAAMPALVVAALTAASSLLGLAFKPLPSFTQVNGAIIALLLPTHLAVLAVVYYLRAHLPSPADAQPARRSAGTKRTR